MSFTAPIMASNPSRIVQIIPAHDDWYAHYKDEEQLAVVCWALIDTGGIGTVVGLVAARNEGTLVPAPLWKPDFEIYFQR